MPTLGAKLFAASSAVMRHSMAWPRGSQSAAESVSRWPAAMRICQATRSIPVVISVYRGAKYDFILKQPPAAELIKMAAGVKSGSGEPNRMKVAKITVEQVRRIAERKMPDLNTYKIESAMEIIKGTARNMGVEVVDG